MLRRIRTAPVGVGSPAGGAPSASCPNVNGDLDDLLTPAPAFRVRRLGYDRLQVDNYVTWAESELAAGRREVDHLLSRYGAASAELELSRRLLAQAPKGRDHSAVSDRVAEILRLAGEEATEILEGARAEADQILDGARLEADVRLRKAHGIKEAAVEASDQLRALAHAERAEAEAVLQGARAEAEDVVREARAEHAQVTGELAEARAQLADVRAEIDDLRQERNEARELLHLLTERIGQALDAVSGVTEERFVVLGNRVQAVSS
jgi:chromosome segregation ATPase